jgi:hypothetical protein
MRDRNRKRKNELILWLVVFSVVCAIYYLFKRTRGLDYELNELQSSTLQSSVVCECSHPNSLKPGENGFHCSNASFDAFCPHNMGCIAQKGDRWFLGDYPCGGVTCECVEPGSQVDTRFQCTDPRYDGRCEGRDVCLAPRWHSWTWARNPCGPMKLAKELDRVGVYSPLELRSACLRTLATVDPNNAHLCDEYERLPLLVPNCTRSKQVVPRILHTVGAGKNTYIASSIAASNPTYTVKAQNDSSAKVFIEEYCGTAAAKAYECLAAPSYRADLFRFCALYAVGGVYLDEDILPVRPLQELISECSVATIGHDFPADNKPAKQMKILSSAPGAPLKKCAMDAIVENVRDRTNTDSP